MIWLIIIGILSGILGGMGMGGGTILIPMLTIVLSYSIKNAQTINLIAFLPMSIFALIIHFKNKLIKIKQTILFIIFGIIGAIGGAFCQSLLDGEYLIKIFGGFLILLGITQLILVFFKKDKHKIFIPQRKKNNVKNY